MENTTNDTESLAAETSAKKFKDSPKSIAIRTSTEAVNVAGVKRKKEESGFKGGKSGNDDNDEEYDPYVNREVKKPLTYRQAIIHLVKGAIGTGILAMPQAFLNAGLVTGVICTIIISVIVTHGMHILIRASYFLCGKQKLPSMSVPEVMTNSFAYGPQKFRKLSTAAGVVTDFYLCVYQLGICSVYVVFIGVTLVKLMSPVVILPLAVWQLIGLIPIMGLICIRNLKTLTPFSAVANFLIIAGLLILTYFLLTGKQSYDDLDLWGNIKTFPLFFGTTLFALTIVGVVLCIENDMKYPAEMIKPFGVLNVGMSLVTIIYLSIGIMGYVYCVSQCQDSITLNLPVNAATSLVQFMYTFGIMFSYPLQAYPAVVIIWGTYVKPRAVKRGFTNLLTLDYVVRISISLLTFALGISVPRLSDFISLFGSFCLSCLGCIFPALVEILLTHPNYGIFNYILFKDLIIIGIGLVGLVAGSWTSLAAIVYYFEK